MEDRLQKDKGKKSITKGEQAMTLSHIRYSVQSEHSGQVEYYELTCPSEDVPMHLGSILKLSGNRVRGLWVENQKACWPETEVGK